MKTHPRLMELLIEAGVSGIKQKDIVIALRNTTKAPEINSILEDWRLAGYVQKFRDDKHAHRPATIWRATEKILELRGLS